MLGASLEAVELDWQLLLVEPGKAGGQLVSLASWLWGPMTALLQLAPSAAPPVFAAQLLDEAGLMPCSELQAVCEERSGLLEVP